MFVPGKERRVVRKKGGWLCFGRGRGRGRLPGVLWVRLGRPSLSSHENDWEITRAFGLSEYSLDAVDGLRIYVLVLQSAQSF